MNEDVLKSFSASTKKKLLGITEIRKTDQVLDWRSGFFLRNPLVHQRRAVKLKSFGNMHTR